LATDLQQARGLAVERGDSVRFELRQEGAAACYVLHTGSKNDCPCAGPCRNGSQRLRTEALAAPGRSWRATSTSFVFDGTGGTVTPTSSITVQSHTGPSLRVVINVLGRVRLCTPGGTFPGYVNC
jgi:type IV fimbrial biogenesis protein FimT